MIVHLCVHRQYRYGGYGAAEPIGSNVVTGALVLTLLLGRRYVSAVIVTWERLGCALEIEMYVLWKLK